MQNFSVLKPGGAALRKLRQSTQNHRRDGGLNGRMLLGRNWWSEGSVRELYRQHHSLKQRTRFACNQLFVVRQLQRHNIFRLCIDSYSARNKRSRGNLRVFRTAAGNCQRFRDNNFALRYIRLKWYLRGYRIANREAVSLCV